MKFLIVSDSHGSSRGLGALLEKPVRDLCGVIHLGDGLAEMQNLLSLERHRHLMLLDVCGNCDVPILLPSPAPNLRVLERYGRRILLTHGHMGQIAYHPSRLAALARENGCVAALHGHTHVPAHLNDRGEGGEESPVEILCPGSIARPRGGSRESYGLADLSEAGLLLSIEEL